MSNLDCYLSTALEFVNIIVKKMTFGDKLAVAAELFWITVKELSFVQCFVLQVVVGMIVWMSMQGGLMFGRALPLWALALSVAGYASILLATVRMGYARYGLVAIGMLLTMMLSAGSAVVVVQDADSRPFGRFPSLNDLVVTYAWMMAAFGVIGGIVATGTYVAWARDRRFPKETSRDDYNG